MNNPNPPIPNPMPPQPPRTRRGSRPRLPSNLGELRQMAKEFRFEYKREHMPYYLLGCSVIVLALFVCGLVTLIILSVLSQPRVADNVTVNGIPVGGMTHGEVEDLLRRTFENAQITLVDSMDNTRRFPVTLAEIGVPVDILQTLDRVKVAQRSERVVPVYVFDERRVEDSLLVLRARIDVQPLAGNPSIDGRSIDIPTMVERLRVDAAGELADGTMDINMLVVEAGGSDESTADSDAEALVHTVAAGQGLIEIADLYGVTVNAIVELNQLENPDLIFEGQELLIPVAITP